MFQGGCLFMMTVPSPVGFQHCSIQFHNSPKSKVHPRKYHCRLLRSSDLNFQSSRGHHGRTALVLACPNILLGPSCRRLQLRPEISAKSSAMTRSLLHAPSQSEYPPLLGYSIARTIILLPSTKCSSGDGVCGGAYGSGLVNGMHLVRSGRVGPALQSPTARAQQQIWACQLACRCSMTSSTGMNVRAGTPQRSDLV